MKTIGLDLGSVTCGISISDALGWIAQALTTVRFAEDDYDDALNKVIAVCKEQKVIDIVLGLPKHMNGDIGFRGEICLAFKDKLEAQGYNVTMWDERLTTAAAQRILIGADVSRKKRKKVIDQMAAVQILQSYLDAKSLR